MSAPKRYRTSEITWTPPAPEANPDRIDAGAPTDSPVFNGALSGAEALAVGAADMIPGALSTARGVGNAVWEGGKALLHGEMPHPVDDWKAGVQETQDQRARVATEHPLLYAAPQIASLAVPGAGFGQLGKVGAAIRTVENPLVRKGAEVLARGALAGGSALAEGADTKGAAKAALLGGVTGTLGASTSAAGRAAGLGANLAIGSDTIGSDAPLGEQIVAGTNMLAGVAGAARGLTTGARGAASDMQMEKYRNARKQSASEAGVAADRAASAAQQESTKPSPYDSAMGEAGELLGHAGSRLGSQVNMRAGFGAPGIDPNHEKLARWLVETGEHLNKQKLAKATGIMDTGVLEWVQNRASEIAAERSATRRAATPPADRKPNPSDYTDADVNIAGAPKRIDDAVFNAGGGKRLPLKNGTPDIGGEYFVESHPITSALTHPKRALGAMANAATGFLRYGPRNVARQIENEPKQMRGVSDFMATRLVKTPDGKTRTEFAYPAEAAAILRAFAAEMRPGAGAKASERLLEASTSSQIRAMTEKDKKANSREKARQAALQKMRSRR